jgi:hypothetical protein
MFVEPVFLLIKLTILSEVVSGWIRDSTENRLSSTAAISSDASLEVPTKKFPKLFGFSAADGEVSKTSLSVGRVTGISCFSGPAFSFAVLALCARVYTAGDNSATGAGV